LKFTNRVDLPEIMDDFTVSGDLIKRTLLEIERINRLLGGNSVTVSGVKYLLKKSARKNMKVTVADLGCGGGEMSMLLHDLGRTMGISMEITGIDANQHIVNFCQGKFANQPELKFEVCDVLSDSFGRKSCDIITATLFMHHFNDDELVALLKGLAKQAKLGIVINDLHRHWFAYYSIKFLTWMFSKSSMVKYDAPLSVRRAFKREELEKILESAGMQDYSLKWRWAFRWQVIVSF
jgi:2-polyprenyl-3-methyl-5-hydroxy-6-metoxy-1,4-benzoquinol methylase